MSPNQSCFSKTEISRRKALASTAVSVVGLSGCLSSDASETLDINSFTSEHAETLNTALNAFEFAYDTVNMPAEDLISGDLETAHSDFAEARDGYRDVASAAEDQDELHTEEETEYQLAFDLLEEYYSLMALASSSGHDALEAILEEDDILAAFVESEVNFEQMERHYSDAQDVDKELNLEVDTLDEEPAEIVEGWVRDHTSEIEDGYEYFREGTESFSSEDYRESEAAYVEAAQVIGELADDISREHATVYPYDSDLYQYYGSVGYHLGRLSAAAEQLAGAAEARSSADYDQAATFETEASDAYEEADESWTRIEEELSGVVERFDRPDLPELHQDREAETDDLDSQDAEQEMQEIWNDYSESADITRNYLAIGYDDYENERYNDAEDWFRTVGEDWDEMEEELSEKLDQYDHDDITNFLSLFIEYASLRASEASEMEDAASARGADFGPEAEDHESDAAEYDDDASGIWNDLEAFVSE